MSMWMMRRGSSAKLGGEIPQSGGERGEHRVRKRGTRLHQREKRAAADGLERTVALRAHIGDARLRGVDERCLAEYAARAEGRDRKAGDRYAHPAFDDGVHANALLSFGDDRRALLVEERRIVVEAAHELG